MTATLVFEPSSDIAAERALRDYLGDVAAEVGIGLESCAVDLDAPMSAYLAVDHRSARFPGRDLALLWDEHRGWSVAVESGCGEDLRVIEELGPLPYPEPAVVRRFLDRVLTG